jgi:hypothetical protein
MTSTVEAHVAQILAPIDPHRGFLSTAENVIDAVERDREVRKSIAALRKRVAGQLIDAKTIERYKDLHGDRPERLGGFPGLTTISSALYLRAVAGLRSAAARPSDAQLAKSAKRLSELLRAEANLPGSLLLETERRASVDPVFAASLDEAVTTIQRNTSALNELAARLQRATNRDDNTAGEPGAKASATCRINGREVGCGVAVLVLVVLIVVDVVAGGKNE